MALDWSAQGNHLATASADNSVIIWDTTTWKPLTTLKNHSDSVLSVAWSPAPKDRYLASASADNSIIIWDTLNEKLVTSLERPQEVLNDPGTGTTIQLSNDNGHTNWVWSVAWSPEGQFLASASVDTTIIIWDTKTWEPLATLKNHSDSVLSVAWSPQGTHLASASADGTVTIWDMSTLLPIAILTGHSDSVLETSWSPKGERLVSASVDKKLIVWNTTNWEPVNILEYHSDPVWSAAWSSEGEFLASSSADRKVIVLSDRFAQSPCDWLVLNLTLSQWQQSRGNALYQPTCPSLPTPAISLERNGLQNYVIHTSSGRIWIASIIISGFGILSWRLRASNKTSLGR